MKTSDPFPVALTAEHAIDRRRLLRAAVGTAALVVVGEWLGRRLHGAASPPGPATLDDPASLAVGVARPLTTADGRAALAVRLDADTVVAFDRRCPHLGCPVRWVAARERFECPCHRAAFDARTGRVLYGPPRVGLTPVTIASR